MRNKILVFICALLVVSSVRAQDHIYSQFYNAPNYLNPALTGQFEGDFRINMIYRSQWTSIPGPLNYYTLSADLKVDRLNGGLGLMVTKSSEGDAYLNKTNLSASYSYSVSFENSALYFGLQAGVTNRKIDADKLVFLDQLGAEGIIPGQATNASIAQFSNKMFFDAGAGINAVIGNFMMGVSGQHLNRPNETLTGVTSLLAPRYNAYASFLYSFNENFEDSPLLIPSVVLYRQEGISSFSAGMQYKYKSVNVGLWYRGDGRQNDAVVVSLIFDLFTSDSAGKTRFGLSHDATTSKLGYPSTAGTTEGALSYETTFPGSGEYQSNRSNATSGRRCYDFY
jgi:type IX secretion system PorP/SprF family membrane protein